MRPQKPEAKPVREWPAHSQTVSLEPSSRRWAVVYDLAYDGGGSDFVEFYRTKTGALVARWLHMNLRSWGGSAKLYDQLEFRPHLAAYWYDEGTGRGDDAEGYRCWCGWFTVGTNWRGRERARQHAETGAVAAVPRALRREEARRAERVLRQP